MSEHAELEHEHDPRSLRGLVTEPQRISRSDEQLINEHIRDRESEQRRAALLDAFTQIEAHLDFIDTNFSRQVAGNHRDRQRAIRHHLHALERQL